MGLLINAYSTLRTLPELDFPHERYGIPGQNTPVLADHLDGFLGYVQSRVSGPMTQTVYHVARHIQRVQNHVSLTVKDAHLDAFAAWAWRANAIVFVPNGTIRDPAGRALVQADGSDPDPAATVPYPEDARERRARVEKSLKRKKIATPATLPPVVGEGEVVFRPAEVVARRCLCLFAVAVRAETLATNDPMPVSEIKQKLGLAWGSFSPAEEAFLRKRKPDHQSVVNFAWRYECLAALQWALGLSKKLPFPDDICDVPAAAQRAIGQNSEDAIRSARLRRAAEILDELDRHLRLHWAARQARLDGRSPPADLDEGVIRERHHALNWLVQFEGREWDAVDTPT